MGTFFDVAQATEPVAHIELYPDDDLGEFTHYFMLERHLQYPVPFGVVVYNEAVAWCREQFGPAYIQWAEAGWCIAFRDRNYAFEFKLRWC